MYANYVKVLLKSLIFSWDWILDVPHDPAVLYAAPG